MNLRECCRCWPLTMSSRPWRRLTQVKYANGILFPAILIAEAAVAVITFRLEQMSHSA